MENPANGTPNLGRQAHGSRVVVYKWFLTPRSRPPVFLLHCDVCKDGQTPSIPSETMSQSPPEETDYIHSEKFLHGLIKHQLKLSISCAAAFLLLLFGMPLLNYFAPELMARRVGGFTVSWLVLGVLFFPYVWIIARIFITRSMALEDAEVRNAAEGNKR
jgi:uncharacterized membrane protein (DUF485 family)